MALDLLSKAGLHGEMLPTQDRIVHVVACLLASHNWTRGSKIVRPHVALNLRFFTPGRSPESARSAQGNGM